MEAEGYGAFLSSQCRSNGSPPQDTLRNPTPVSCRYLKDCPEALSTSSSCCSTWGLFTSGKPWTECWHGAGQCLRLATWWQWPTTFSPPVCCRCWQPDFQSTSSQCLSLGLPWRRKQTIASFQALRLQSLASSRPASPLTASSLYDVTGRWMGSASECICSQTSAHLYCAHLACAHLSGLDHIPTSPLEFPAHSQNPSV